MKKNNNYVRYEGRSGIIVDEMFNPIRHNLTQEEWNKLPNGYVFPEPDPRQILREAKLQILDFSKNNEENR